MHPPTQPTPLVLVADDEPSMLELVASHLKKLINPKVDVLEASDGEQACELAREHLPDLVVLDVMMPGMSGWEVCKRIREDVALAHTGVVMLTGIGENLNEMTSPLYGADAHLDKPFEFHEFDEKVRAALSARASQREGMTRPTVNGVSGPAKVAKAAPPAEAGTAHAKAAPKKKAAKKAAPKAVAKAAKKAAPKKAVAKKAAPKKKAAKKAAPKKTVKKAGTKKAGTKKAGAKKKATAKKAPPKKNKKTKKQAKKK